MTKHFYDELKSINIGKIISIDETSFCNIGVTEEGYFQKGKYPSVMQTKKKSYIILINGCK